MKQISPLGLNKINYPNAVIIKIILYKIMTDISINLIKYL